MDHEIESPITRKLREKDRSAILEMQQKCGSSLESCVKDIMRDDYDRTLPEDRIQAIIDEAIERAFQKGDTYDPKRASICPWISGFIRNVLKENLRKDPIGSSLPLGGEPPVSGNHDYVCDSQPTPEIQRALDELDERNPNRNYEEVILSTFYRGESDADIAKRLGKARNTVRGIRKDALDALRKQMEDATEQLPQEQKVSAMAKFLGVTKGTVRRLLRSSDLLSDNYKKKNKNSCNR
jgi:DNA-directed RNA polymerase specialized sigma24 family protein